jgi:recombination protein RecA
MVAIDHIGLACRSEGLVAECPRLANLLRFHSSARSGGRRERSFRTVLRGATSPGRNSGQDAALASCAAPPNSWTASSAPDWSRAGFIGWGDRVRAVAVILRERGSRARVIALLAFGRMARLIRSGSTQSATSKKDAKSSKNDGAGGARGGADRGAAVPENGKGLEPQRKQALDFALQQIGKKCGQGAIMYLGDETRRQVDTISTGSISLDRALGVGGLPRSRVVEVYGPESSGKTTLTLHVVANAQKNGGVAAFIDAEHALDPTYAQKLGVDLDQLLVSQPDSGEQALEIAEMLVASSAVDVVVIDSVAALVPRAELEGQMGDSHVGLQARLMSQALRKLTGVIHRSNTCVVFINQIREKIGVMFGSPETTTGGRALKFYSSVRLDIRRIGSIKSDGDISGNRTVAKVVKNKLAPPFRKAEFDIIFDRGISYHGDLLDLAVEENLVTKSGTWFSLGKERLGQGRERAVQFLREHEDLARKLDDDVRRRVFGDAPPPTPEPADPEA